MNTISITEKIQESLRASEACPTIAFINAKKVTINEKQAIFSELEFEGSYCFQDDITHFCVQYYLTKPVWESSIPTSRNYFVGRTELIWNSIPHTSFDSESPHLQINFSTKHLSLEKTNKKIFQIAEENLEEINWLTSLLFNHQKSGDYVSYFTPEFKKKYEDEEDLIADLWDELKGKRLIYQEKVLFPIYLYCINSPNSIDYYKIKSKDFELIWLTPNVCVTNNTKNFENFLTYTFGNLERIHN